MKDPKDTKNFKARAQLFQDGEGQAVRLPAGMEFAGEDEVQISKVGNYLIINSVSEPEHAGIEQAFALLDELEISDRDQPTGSDEREEL